ncbi:MAG: sigma-54-dependent Fis family transcriptional regulator [Deltaproteobacteria bacterium]|nr:MAG: sigma-54-dependent Fis family transcriptional regulator [Deltaproteobacteria bacterium]
MTKPTVLVVDDEELLRWSLVEHLKGEGYDVAQGATGVDAIEQVRAVSPDLVLLDLKMPEMDGMTALRKLREEGFEVPVVVLTAHGGVDSAVEATRLGAADYLSKPFDLREISLVVEKAIDDDRLRQEVLYLRSRQRNGYGEFIGASKALTGIFSTLQRLEGVDAPTVLIQGESGTGKDVLARAIHANGPRKDRVFMEVDCAALPEQLIESELFGHEKGAFTDARTMKRGLIEVARGGVVFLDEIGEMSLGTQAKLLRALESRRFKRVGGVATLHMDAAVIAATNRDLKSEVKEGKFREDLYFRLHVIPLQVPALRERTEDIPLLIEHFLDRFNRQFGRKVTGLSAEAMQRLRAYPWPGNVRELRNVLERLVLLGDDGVIQAAHLPPEIRYAAQSRPSTIEGCPFVLPEVGVDLEEVDRGLLIQALQRTDGNQSAAARLLSISRYALRYRMEKYGLLQKGGPKG